MTEAAGRTRREQFDQDGYFVLPRLFSTEETVRLKEEVRSVLEQLRGSDKYDSVRKQGVLVGLAARNESFKRAAVQPVLTEALREVVGDGLYFLSDKIVFKNAEADYGSPWHQDYMYWKGSHKLSVWIALDRATPDNGCLKIIPGSHRAALMHDGDTSDGLGFGHRVDPDAIDEAKAVAVPLEAGGAVVFHDLLLHASYPNVSGKDRWALISTYKDSLRPDPEYPWAVAGFSVFNKE